MYVFNCHLYDALFLELSDVFIKTDVFACISQSCSKINVVKTKKCLIIMKAFLFIYRLHGFFFRVESEPSQGVGMVDGRGGGDKVWGRL